MFTTNSMNKPKVRLPQNVQAGIYKADVIRVTLNNYLTLPQLILAVGCGRISRYYYLRRRLRSASKRCRVSDTPSDRGDN